MRQKLGMAFAILMVTLGAISVWERPVNADGGGPGTCCALANPYTCHDLTCQDIKTCFILDGTCG